MPRVGFVCPDGEQITFEECLKACRMGTRCYTKATLVALAKTRPWTGTPSTTQLLNGTRKSWLEITYDYYVAPPRMAFALLGTRVHLGLADAESDVSLVEEKLIQRGVSGTPDCYEDDGSGGILTDYKTWGSWRVARAIGVVDKKVPDPTGAVYKTSGKTWKKGEPKMVKVYEIDPSQADPGESLWQLNHYRLLYEESGFPVSSMQIEVIVRDGGTFVATNRGVDGTMYLIPVPKVDDGEVRHHFEARRLNLLHYLDTETMPPPCTDEERWEGRRCRDYCDVAEFCDVGRFEKAAGGKKGDNATPDKDQGMGSDGSQGLSD